MRHAAAPYGRVALLNARGGLAQAARAVLVHGSGWLCCWRVMRGIEGLSMAVLLLPDRLFAALGMLAGKCAHSVKVPGTAEAKVCIKHAAFLRGAGVDAARSSRRSTHAHPDGLLPSMLEALPGYFTECCNFDFSVSYFCFSL